MDAPKRLTQKGYRPRLIEERLDTLMRAFGCVEINGPKWCGKTWTALSRSASVSRLDEPAQRAAAEVDPSLALIGDAPHLVDEWQEVPEVWDAARRFVDASGNERGHFCSRARPRSKARSAAMFVIPARVGSPVCQCAPWPCVSRATASRSCHWQASLRARILPLSVARARWMTSPAGAAGAVGLQILGFRKILRERRQASTCTRCSTSTCWTRACRLSLHTAFCELLP